MAVLWMRLDFSYFISSSSPGFDNLTLAGIRIDVLERYHEVYNLDTRNLGGNNSSGLYGPIVWDYFRNTDIIYLGDTSLYRQVDIGYIGLEPDPSYSSLVTESPYHFEPPGGNPYDHPTHVWYSLTGNVISKIVDEEGISLPNIVGLFTEQSDILNFSDLLDPAGIFANTSYNALPEVTKKIILANFVEIGGASPNITYDARAGDDIVTLPGQDEAAALGYDLTRTFFGGDGDDVITGSSADNTISGGQGNDRIDGTGGSDTASYENATSSVTINLGITSEQETGGAGNDTLIRIENLIGSNYDDHLIGNEYDNELYGGEGDDTLLYSAGDDILDGGANTANGDTVDYSASHNGIHLNQYSESVTLTPLHLATEITLQEYRSGADQISNFENFITGSASDVVIGDTGNNTIRTGDGVDTVVYTGGIDDNDGGDDEDLITFQFSSFGVHVDMRNGTQTNIGHVRNFEQVIGSNHNDIIVGNSELNTIYGGAGSDEIYGGGGGDFLYGSDLSAENLNESVKDILTGGTGSDVFFVGNNDIITDLEVGETVIIPTLNTVGSDDYIAVYSNSDLAVTVIDIYQAGSLNPMSSIKLEGRLQADKFSVGFDGSQVVLQYLGTDNGRFQSDTDWQSIFNKFAPLEGRLENIGVAVQQDISDFKIVIGTTILLAPFLATSLPVTFGAVSLAYGTKGLVDWFSTYMGGKYNNEEEALAGFIAAFVDFLPISAAVDFFDDTSIAIGQLGGEVLGLAADALFPILDNKLTEIENDNHDFTPGDDAKDGDDNSQFYFPGGGSDQTNLKGGNDFYVAGAGHDTADGGEGIDTVLFSGTSEGVNVDLSTRSANGSEIDTEVLLNFENVIAGSGSDTVVGNDLDNVLEGNEGDDIIRGGSGDDIIRGGRDDAVSTRDTNLGSGQIIKEAGHGNNSLDSALDVNSEFSLAADVDIANATTIAHVTVTGTGDGTSDFYQVTALKDHATITLDIDYGSFDAGIYLWDNSWNPLAYGDDSDISDGAGGSISEDDPFVTHTFTEAGTYYIQVADYSGNIGNSETYELQISIDNEYLVISDDDHLFGDAGDDILTGGVGADTLYGGTGDDSLYGGYGGDWLNGDAGADLLFGQAGTDLITLGGSTYHTAGYVAHNVSSSTQVGTDARINLAGLVRIEAVADGGTDFDTIQLSSEGDAFFLHDAYSRFNSSVSLVNDYVGNESAARFSNIEQINGLGGDDIIDLTSPDYSLAGIFISIDGGAGNDVIWGSDADEIIYGGADNDTLFGGIGTDTLEGGAGADVFEFTRTSTDTSVLDFDPTEGDTLRFYDTGGAVFDENSLTLTDDGILIDYLDTATSQIHQLDIALAETADDFNLTLVDIQGALDVI